MTDLSGNSLLYGQHLLFRFESLIYTLFNTNYMRECQSSIQLVCCWLIRSHIGAKGRCHLTIFPLQPSNACAFDSLSSQLQLNWTNSLTAGCVPLSLSLPLYTPGKLFNILTCNFLSIFHNTCTLIQFFFFTQRSSSTLIHNLYNLYFLHKRKNILSQLLSSAVYPLHTIARRSPCLQFTLHSGIPFSIDGGERVGKGMETTMDSESL